MIRSLPDRWWPKGLRQRSQRHLFFFFSPDPLLLSCTADCRVFMARAHVTAFPSACRLRTSFSSSRGILPENADFAFTSPFPNGFRSVDDSRLLQKRLTIIFPFVERSVEPFPSLLQSLDPPPPSVSNWDRFLPTKCGPFTSLQPFSY